MRKSLFIEGTLIATIGIFIVKILGIIYVIPFYSIIGASGGALYGYAYNIYNIFLSLSSIGIPLAISRLTSEYNALNKHYLKVKTYQIGRRLILILSIFSFLLLMFFAPNIAYLFIGNIKGGNTIEDITFVIRMIALSILIIPTLSVVKGYLQGHKYITVTSISQVIEQLVRVMVIILGSYIVIKVLNLPVKIGVGIAVFGATIGGLVAYLYLLFKMHKDKKIMTLPKTIVDDEIEVPTKDIVKRILSYSLPFIVSSIILSLYDFVDLATVVKTLVNSLEYNVLEAETIMSIFSTWGNKLGTIVTIVATGLSMSLIPNITDSFVKDNLSDVRDKINRSLQILLFTTIPMTVGLSILALPLWTVFYGYNVFDAQIFAYYIFISLFSSLITVCNVLLQSLNEQKKMFKYIIIGFSIKIILNIPLMYLFDYIGLNASYGVITATIIGFSSNIFLTLRYLSKKLQVNYSDTLNKMFNIIFNILIMITILMLFKLIIPIDTIDRFEALFILLIYTLMGFLTYLVISFKQGLITNIFGTLIVEKIISKININHHR